MIINYFYGIARKSLIDLRAERGTLTIGAVGRAKLAAGDSSTERLESALIRLGLAWDHNVANVFAGARSLSRLGIEAVPREPVCIERLNPRFLLTARVLPLADEEDELGGAVADPFDEFSIQAIRFEVKKPVRVEEALGRLYDDPYGCAAASDADEEGFSADSERLRDMASEAPVIRPVSRLIKDAVERGASDIRIEPFENRLKPHRQAHASSIT